MVIFNLGIVKPTYRINFEPEPLWKLWWFVSGPLKNALAMVVLNDELGKNRIIHITAVVLSCAVLLGGAWWQWKRGGAANGMLWLGTLVVLGLLSFSVNLVSMDRYVTYRHIWALTSILFIFGVSSLIGLLRFWRSAGKAVPAALSLLLVASLVMAHGHTYELVALPQAEELAAIENKAKNIDIRKKPRVFILTPERKDGPCLIRFGDEFGSLSTQSDWVPREMLDEVMKERFPSIRDVTKRYQVKCGETLPAKEPCEVVIDLRNLRNMETEEALDQLGPVEMASAPSVDAEAEASQELLELLDNPMR